MYKINPENGGFTPDKSRGLTYVNGGLTYVSLHHVSLHVFSPVDDPKTSLHIYMELTAFTIES